MKLGQIIGVTWSSRKVKELNACRLYLVQPVKASGEIHGKPLVVADPQNLGAAGDTVVYVTSTDATHAFESGFAPVNASIVELVDKIV